MQEFPITIFQTLLNEGKGELPSEALKLLKTKFSGVSYMEYLQMNEHQEALQTRFPCSSKVVCFDVSPRKDFMVCECDDGAIQLWSLDSGNLKWTRFVELPKGYFIRFVFDPCPHLNQPNLIDSFYRSVVFHPSKDVILPGILSKCYTFNGDQKSLFPSSKCYFHVCSISGDEIFTDCLDDAKCVIAWSLNDGREITRVKRNEVIVSFAMSRDGKLLAISHSSGCVCLVDRENGFTTLAEATLESVSGLIRFTEDSRFPLGGVFTFVHGMFFSQLGVSVDAQRNFSLDVIDFPLEPLESEWHSVGGFLLGDPPILRELGLVSDFVLNRQSLLRNDYCSPCIEMIYRNKATEGADGKFIVVTDLAFSSTGETIYIKDSSGGAFIYRIMAWEVSNWKLKTEKEFSSANRGHVLVVREGVLIPISRTLELWNFELSYCIRQWSLDVASMFAISDDQVLCEIFSSAEDVIVDTVTGDVVSKSTSTLAVSSYKLIACYRNLHLLANTDIRQVDYGIRLQQLGQSVPRWELSLPRLQLGCMLGCFSPKGQFIVVGNLSERCLYVLDVFSGIVRFKLSDRHELLDFKFISDEEIVILSYRYTRDTIL